MSRGQVVAAGAAGVVAFAAGFYLALALVVAAVGIDEPFEARLELTAMLFGTVFSVLAVAVASGSFGVVIGRVAVAGLVSAAGAGAALVLVESDPIILAIAGLLVVGAEVTAAHLSA